MSIGTGWYEDEVKPIHDDIDELRPLALSLLQDKLKEAFSYKHVGIRGGRYYG